MQFELPKSKIDKLQSEASEGNLSLMDQVIADLSSYLNQFTDQKKAIKIAARKMRVHEKTLKRILEGQNKPGYLTLYKIYKEITNASNNTELLSLAPKVVSDYIKKTDPKDLEEEVVATIDIETEMVKDPVFSEIYYTCATIGTRHSDVVKSYGQYGSRILDKMIQLDIVKLSQDGKFILSKNRSSYSVETLKRVGMHFADKFFKTSDAQVKGKNFIGLLSMGLNKNAYSEWLKIDEEAFLKKIQLSKKNGIQGDIPVFSYVVSDTLKNEGEEN